MTVELIQRAHWHHPEWCALAVSALGWVTLVVIDLGSPSPLVTHPQAMTPWGLLVVAAPMTMAMMAPLVLPQVRHVCRSSLWPRRYRAAGAFLIGFLSVWVVASALIMLVGSAAVARLGWLPVVTLAFALACMASLSPHRRALLRQCSFTVPLRIRGRAADRDCLAYGGATAQRCLLTCVPLMSAAMIGHGLLTLAGATAIAVVERRRCDLDPAHFAVAVAALGMVSVLGALALGSAPGHLDHV